MKFSDAHAFKRTLTLAVTVPFGGMLVLAAGLLFMSIQVRGQADRVRQSLEVRHQAGLTQAYMARMVAAHRGYLVTGNSSFLAPYRDARSQVAAHLARLEAVVAADAGQRAHVRALADDQTRWIALAESEIALRRRGDPRLSPTVSVGGAGGAMERIFDRLDAFREAEHEDEARQQRTLEVMRWGAIALGILATGATAAFFALFSRRQIEALHGSFKESLEVAERQKNELSEQAEALRAANEALLSSAEDLQALYDQLRELDTLKSNFLGAVTHELRTPLASITGYAEFLEDGFEGPLTSGQGEYVRQIQLAARRLRYLVDDLLDMNRLDAGTFRLDLNQYDICRTIRDVTDSLGPLFVEAGLTPRLELPEAPVWIEMDIRRIEQVLVNLLSNAIKFSDPGSEVTLRLAVEVDHLRCAILDRGIGIAAADIPRLFQRFVQLDGGDARRAGGAGLGLSICKALVTAHGGQIGVESEPGAGSTFWFTLPKKSGPPA